MKKRSWDRGLTPAVFLIIAVVLAGGAFLVRNAPDSNGQLAALSSSQKKSASEKKDRAQALRNKKTLADIERELAIAQKNSGISPISLRDIEKKLKNLESQRVNTAAARAMLGKLKNGEMPRLVSASESNEPPLLLKSIGVDLGYFDASTGRAGDFVFTKNQLQFNVLFTEFGFTIPANQSATRTEKRNPQPTFILPLGTKVRSLVDGVVVEMPKLYSNDYSIMVAPSLNTNWRYETEHVINPLVKVGDRVTAGQVIAEVSPHSSTNNSGYGLVEIGILRGGNNGPQHLCPFAYLDPSIKDEVQKKLRAFYAAWEEYRGDTTLHNEAAQSMPGCLTLTPIEG